MRYTIRIAFLGAWAVAAAGAWAAPDSAAVHAEVMALLGRLQSSGCQFERNGSRYSASEAQAHLVRKLEYLEGRNLVKSTEDFIALGASTSSSSGKPYRVKCNATPAVESKAWLTDQLRQMRRGP